MRRLDASHALHHDIDPGIVYDIVDALCQLGLVFVPREIPKIEDPLYSDAIAYSLLKQRVVVIYDLRNAASYCSVT